MNVGIIVRGHYKAQLLVDGFQPDSIVLNYDNCPEPDGTTCQPMVGFLVALEEHTLSFNLIPKSSSYTSYFLRYDYLCIRP